MSRGTAWPRPAASLPIPQRRAPSVPAGLQRRRRWGGGDGTKAASAELGRGIITFSPLAQGLLADRYLEGVPSDSRMAHDPRCLRRSSLTSDVHDKIVRLNDIAAGRGQALAEMALA